MTESQGELRFFILQLPSNIEQAQRSLVSSNVNSLEQWHIRMQNAINLLNLLCERSQNYEQTNFYTCLDTLRRETHQVYQQIETQLYSNQRTHSRNIMNDETFLVRSINSYGRPRKNISKEDIEREFRIFRNWKLVASQLCISSKTLRRRRVEYGMEVSPGIGPRTVYSDISHDELCNVVSSILNILPDAGETMVIGSLRARGIFVQRNRIRSAIIEVDPVNRALRRTVSIVRRCYNVASPNSLW